MTTPEVSFKGLRGTLENLDFSFFPNLLSLDLAENNLTGTIPNNIGMSSKLIYLDLSGNSLNGSLPLSIANLTKIYEFDVSRNKITGILDYRLFPSGGGTMTGLLSLQHFLLQGNFVLGGRIPEEIRNLKFLTLLTLDGNSFYGPIPSSLGNLENLGITRRIIISPGNLTCGITIIHLNHSLAIIAAGIHFFFSFVLYNKYCCREITFRILFLYFFEDKH